MTSTIGRAGLALGAIGLLAGTLTGCGGSSTATNTAPAAATGASASGAPGASGASGQRRQFFDPAMQKKIAQCLEAAGLPVPTFSPRPSGERPSGSFPPTGPRPTGPRPTGTGGVRGPYSDPKVRAALEACGIQFPTFRPGGQGGPGGSGAPQGAPATS